MADWCYTEHSDPNLVTISEYTVPVYTVYKKQLRPISRVYCTNHRSLTPYDIQNAINEDGCVQLFTGGPSGFRPEPLPREIVNIFKQNGDNVPLYVHCPFNIDLSSPDRGSYDAKKLLNYINSEPELSKTCVLHMGRYSNEQLSRNINDIRNNIVNYQDHYPLLLEVSSKSQVGSTWESIRHVFEGIDNKWVSICFDTQHMFSSGMCSFEGDYSFINAVSELDSLGIQLQMIHLNDSSVPYGDGLDRHAPLGHGHIWGRNFHTLYPIVEYARDDNIKLVGETKDSQNDRNVINTILEYYN